MRKYTSPFSSQRRYQTGLTLIELMIAVLLGLLVVAAGMGLLLSNRKTYGSTQAVSRIQENQRIAFELLSADIRSAGDYPCLALSTLGRVVVHANEKSSSYPEGFDKELFDKQRYGLEGEGDNVITIYSSDKERGSFLANSDAMGYRYAVVKHDNPEDPVEIFDASVFTPYNVSARGRNIVLCNADRAVVFNASKVEGNQIYHENSAGNCGNAFIHDPSNNEDVRNALSSGKCNEAIASKNGRDRYCFGPNAKAGENGCDRVGNSPAFVINMNPADTKIQWKLEGNSLLRDGQEIVDGVESMALKYRLNGEDDYKSAGSISGKDWGLVDSVHVKITFAAPGPEKGANMDRHGTDGKDLTRSMEGYVAIRNQKRNQPNK